MTLIVDASSLILLGKISLLSKFVESNKIVIPEKVYREVVIGKEKARFDAFLLERLVREGKIDKESVDNEDYEKILRLFGLWAGDAEIMALASKMKSSVITDDRKCLNVAKAIGIKAITSMDVILSLLSKKHIGKRKALASIDLLEEYGWYKKDIIKFYRRKIK